MSEEDDYIEWLKGAGSSTISKYIINIVSRFMRSCQVENLTVTFRKENITAFHIMSSVKHINHFNKTRSISTKPDPENLSITFRRFYSRESKGNCVFEFDVIENQLNANTVTKLQKKTLFYLNQNP